MSDEDSPYPHWKEALFGDDGHVANAYCAVKYGFWHASHALLAGTLTFALVVILIARLPIVLIEKALDLDVPDSFKIGAIPRLRAAAGSEQGKRVAHHLTTFILLFGGVTIIAGSILFFLVKPIAFTSTIIGITIVLGGAVVEDRYSFVGRLVSYIDSKVCLATKRAVPAGKVVVKKSSQVKEQSKETPYLRRLLGYCPVSMDIDPKWYDSFEDRLFSLLDQDDETNDYQTRYYPDD